MASVLEGVPLDAEHARYKARHHAQILKTALHKGEKLKANVKKKIKPNI